MALPGTMVALPGTVVVVVPSLSGTAVVPSLGTVVVSLGTTVLRPLLLAQAQGQVSPALMALPLPLQMTLIQ